MAYDPDIAITLWPEYFDINRTRSEGRRLPKELCVSNPDLDIIAKGAMILDLSARTCPIPRPHAPSTAASRSRGGLCPRPSSSPRSGRSW